MAVRIVAIMVVVRAQELVYEVFIASIIESLE